MNITNVEVFSDQQDRRVIIKLSQYENIGNALVSDLPEDAREALLRWLHA